MKRGKHFGNVGGVVLTVAVQRHDDAGAGCAHAAAQSPTLPGIAAVPDDAQHRNFRFQFQEPRQGIVRRAVVDEHNLDIFLSDRTNNLSRQGRHILRFIFHRHDDR